MKFAILGGTHGNEWVGIDVIKKLEESRASLNSIHEFKTFLGNPQAFEKEKRFVDSDLNRAFGVNGYSKGYEKQRSAELEKLIVGKYDFLIDLHTTTTDMGLTVILNRNDDTSFKAACYLQKIMPDIKLILAPSMNESCPYTNAMVKSGITVEVGPVANNVICENLVKKSLEMVESLLTWGFDETFDYSKVEYYQTTKYLHYPEGEGWSVTKKLLDKTFYPINKGDITFENKNGELFHYDKDETVYPFFINEAAYQKDRIGMSLSVKKKGLVIGD